MRLFIVLRSAHYFRLIEQVVQEVGNRGGRVTLVTDNPAQLKLPAGLADASWFTVGPLLVDDSWFGRHVLQDSRRLYDYCHWLAQGVQPRPVLDQLCDKVPGFWGGIARRLRRWRAERLLAGRGVRQGLTWLEAIARPIPAIIRQIQQAEPDLVLAVSKVFGASPETDYEKACQVLGLPSVVSIATWDNLTSKGTFHVPPQRVIVWNDTQIEEAVRYHHIPRDKVISVGAPAFDDAFERHWQIPRVDFCRLAGLDPQQAYLIYGVSSPRMWGDETEIVCNLRRELNRLAGGEQVQLLVRPHPRKPHGWEEFALEGVSIWPTPSLPDTPTAKTELYNAVFHSAGVVALSTSLFLEGAILDRPGFTFRFDQTVRVGRPLEHSASADYSLFLHYEYLLQGDFLECAADEAACAEKIMVVLAGHDERCAARRAFVSRFVRPGGREVPAYRVMADTLERLARATDAIPHAAAAVPQSSLLKEASEARALPQPAGRSHPSDQSVIEQPGN